MFYESEGLTFEDLEQNYPWIKRGYITDLSINHVRPKTLSATTYHMEETAPAHSGGSSCWLLAHDLAKRYEEMGLMKILLPNEASYEVKHHWAYRENLHKQVAEFLSQMTRLL